VIHVVIGPPCAGKSAYVEAHAAEGEVQLDFDKLAAAMGSTSEHHPPKAIADVTFSARQAAINRILARKHPAWIIHTNPPEDQVAEYKAAGVKFLLVDPGEDVCLERARKRPDGTEAAVRRWYRNPPDVVADAERVKGISAAAPAPRVTSELALRHDARRRGLFYVRRGGVDKFGVALRKDAEPVCFATMAEAGRFVHSFPLRTVHGSS
jgi:hypothetical protein